MSVYFKKEGPYYAFQVTKESFKNTGIWPSWLLHAWDKKEVYNSVGHDKESKLMVKGETTFYKEARTFLIEWGDYIIHQRSEEKLKAMNKKTFETLFISTNEKEIARIDAIDKYSN